jgi:hypothetical protein
VLSYTSVPWYVAVLEHAVFRVRAPSQTRCRTAGSARLGVYTWYGTSLHVVWRFSVYVCMSNGPTLRLYIKSKVWKSGLERVCLQVARLSHMRTVRDRSVCALDEDKWT